MADTDREDRPSPDALLAEVKRAARGRLKIFLGAAPGVGKTYAMLESAHERLKENVDVIVGVVETHGRTETSRLLEGLPIIPLREADYRGRVFNEMDVEAILARKPKIVLVDELAHSNVPGSRHLKRYQDVEDILSAGIDVYSTLNIQHLESLNDVVERIAGIKVRETVPDSVLASADEIEVIDLSPADLLKRLAEGKVYVPETARRAISNFFSEGNLTALRELALRHAAERVDAQMVSYMRAHAISGPWPTRERIIACIGDDGKAQRIVRYAKRVAERRQIPWVAVFVETPHHMSRSEAEKDRIAQALKLAEELGGETVTLQGDDVVGELLAYANEHNCTQLVIGRPKRLGWRSILSGSVARRMIRRSGAFDVLMVGGDETDKTAPPLQQPRQKPKDLNWLNYATAIGGVAVATGVGFVIDLWLPPANISVAFLVAILLIASKIGRGPAIFASVASFLSFNFFFTKPRLAFKLTDTENVLTIVFFLIAAVIVSNLASRLRARIDQTRLSARRMATLYEFNRRIAAAATQDDVLWAVVHHVAATIHGKSLIMLPSGGQLLISAGYPPEDTISEKDVAAASWTWANGKPSGRGSTTLPAADWLFLPLKTARGTLGVLGMQREGKELLAPDESRLMETLADQAAVAIERTALVADLEAARVAGEAERLRQALLSSISQDLRTPLVAILSAASSLLDDDQIRPSDRRELALIVKDEAERLNRFVQNLLDMTRLGSGALKPKADWIDLRVIVSAAVERCARLLKDRDVKIDIPADVSKVRVDSVLMEQVLCNLIDNACKYSPAGTLITIWARNKAGNLLMEVCDQGSGIPEAERERVFDRFYRIKPDGQESIGTGLGLAICRGIVEAHGGRIKAETGLNGVGTCIVMNLPVTDGAAAAPKQAEKAESPA
jgi:two-component system sensor histidine kinase KdpD